MDSALNKNLFCLGESRVQETEEKITHWQNRSLAEIHLIGHLQSNKVRKAVEHYDVIQTVDSIKLARQINTISSQEEKQQKIFLQVNTGQDINKHGFSQKEIIAAAKEIAEMKNVLLIGIMTIPPNNISKEKLHSIYKNTRKTRDAVKKSIETRCNNLSMGMSNDYETAIAEGATHIRLGKALFGERPK